MKVQTLDLNAKQDMLLDLENKNRYLHKSDCLCIKNQKTYDCGCFSFDQKEGAREAKEAFLSQLPQVKDKELLPCPICLDEYTKYHYYLYRCYIDKDKKIVHIHTRYCKSAPDNCKDYYSPYIGAVGFIQNWALETELNCPECRDDVIKSYAFALTLPTDKQLKLRK